jgi:hypothetical protein
MHEDTKRDFLTQGGLWHGRQRMLHRPGNADFHLVRPHARTRCFKGFYQAMCNLLHTDLNVISRNVLYRTEKNGGQGGN